MQAWGPGIMGSWPGCEFRAKAQCLQTHPCCPGPEPPLTRTGQVLGMRAEVPCLVPLMGSLRAKAFVTEMSKEDGVRVGDSGSDDGFSGDDGDRSDSNNGVSGVKF